MSVDPLLSGLYLDGEEEAYKACVHRQSCRVVTGQASRMERLPLILTGCLEPFSASIHLC